MARAQGRGWIFGMLGVALLAAVVYYAVAHRATRAKVVYGGATPAATLVEGLRQGDERALAECSRRVGVGAQGVMPECSPEEATTLVEILGGLRVGFLGFSPQQRAAALAAGTKVLDRFAVETAPTEWFGALQPTHDMLTAALADPALTVRVAAMGEIARLWSYAPGMTMTPAQDETLAEWKQSFHAGVVRRLADAEPQSRVAAVACLGLLAVDRSALPAIAYLDDPVPIVRQQVLASFARRPDLLTEDAIIRKLHDPFEAIGVASEMILRARGLTREQIGLAQIMTHAKPEMRASVIPMLKDRTDVDPTVWLLQLSRDSDEFVRAQALDALSSTPTPEVRRRLREMAASDPSPAIKQAAAKIAPPDADSTAALPPLPGSSGLNPRAN